MNPSQLADLVLQHKWIGAAAIGIGMIVRLLKSDTKIPLDVDPRLRVWLALALGAASGAVDKLIEAGDTTWTIALVQGSAAAMLAILGHATVIGSLRDGKEIAVPGLTKANTPPGPGKPPSLPPPNDRKTIRDPAERKTPGELRYALEGAAIVLSIVTGGMLLVLYLSACGFTPAQEARGILVAEDIACILEKAYLDEPALNAACKLLTPAQRATARDLAAMHRAGVARQLASQRVAVASCGPAIPLADDADAGKR
jgi:hypothetical protein